jgi:hypothetical protein
VCIRARLFDMPGQGATYFDRGAGFVLQLILLIGALSVLAYDFIKSGRRR